MVKLTTMLSVWLWGGIFVFLYLYFRGKREIKKAELDSVHLCVIFFICCLVGLPIAIMEIFNLWEDDDEEEEYNINVENESISCDETSEENIEDETEDEEEYDEVIVEYLENLKYEIDLFLRHFR